MCELKIQARALHHNIRLVRRMAGDAQIIGVVKGNGYGLGLRELSGHLVEYGIETLAVSELEDVVALRRWGIPARVMLLTPLYSPGDLETALEAGAVLCIDSRAGARAAEQAARRLGVDGQVQLCVDTGFGRYGFSWEDVQTVWESARSLERLRVVGTYSHLSRSGCRDGRENAAQCRRFLSLCDGLEQAGVEPGVRHLADSYGMLRSPELRLDAVRIGSAFLGRLPFPDEWGFERIGTLSAPVREVRTLAAGSTVGYGGGAVTRRTTQIAVVAAGYAHGFGLEREKKRPGGLRSALKTLCSPRKQVPLMTAGERRLPVLGSVGMCATVLDATDVPLRVGDRVELPVNPLLVNAAVPRSYV